MFAGIHAGGEMKHLFRAGVVYAALLFSNSIHAQSLHLKCAVGGPFADESHVSWIEIDQAANSMRVKGESLALNVTADRYSSTSRGTKAFSTLHSIDRATGEITVADLYEGKIVGTKKGSCEKGTPPATKF
jgi:hypothetical protein